MIVLYVLAAWCGLSIPAALLCAATIRNGDPMAVGDHTPETHAFVFYSGPRDGDITDDLSVLDTAPGPAGQYGPSGNIAVVHDTPRHVLQWFPLDGGHRNPPYCKLAEHPGCPAYGMTGA